MTAPVRQRAILALGSSGRFDARAGRFAGTLAARGHEVAVIARSAPGLPAEERLEDGTLILRVPVPGFGGGLPGSFRRLGVALAIAAQVRAARRVVRARAAAGMPPDLVIALGFLGLPVALGIAGATRGSGPGRPRPPVVYDASDVYAVAGRIARLPGPVRVAFARLEDRLAARTALVLTANEGYADLLAPRFGRRPLVLLNAPSFAAAEAALASGGHPLRDALGVDATRPVVLYHGGISPERGIEQLIEATAGFPGVLLAVLGYGPLEGPLRARVAREGLGERVRILPAVPGAELPAWIADADVAAMPIQPTTLNHRLTVPNKLLEAMAAGTAVLASDLPGMAPIVREAGCGILVDPTSPAAIADGIRAILGARPDVRANWREAGRRAAEERYSWEHEAPRFLDALEALTGRPW